MIKPFLETINNFLSHPQAQEVRINDNTKINSIAGAQPPEINNAHEFLYILATAGITSLSPNGGPPEGRRQAWMERSQRLVLQLSGRKPDVI